MTRVSGRSRTPEPPARTTAQRSRPVVRAADGRAGIPSASAPVLARVVSMPAGRCAAVMSEGVMPARDATAIPRRSPTRERYGPRRSPLRDARYSSQVPRAGGGTGDIMSPRRHRDGTGVNFASPRRRDQRPLPSRRCRSHASRLLGAVGADLTLAVVGDAVDWASRHARLGALGRLARIGLGHGAGRARVPAGGERRSPRRHGPCTPSFRRDA
jgi:hypothetical protein